MIDNLEHVLMRVKQSYSAALWTWNWEARGFHSLSDCEVTNLVMVTIVSYNVCYFTNFLQFAVIKNTICIYTTFLW